LSEVEAAEAIVRDRQAEPSGTVRISASIPVVQGELAACLPALARRYPRLRIEVEVSDRFIDLAQEGIDIALRSHFGPLPDSGLCSARWVASASCWWRPWLSGSRAGSGHARAATRACRPADRAPCNALDAARRRRPHRAGGAAGGAGRQ
jgi:DNA-binding transcriptional LysR family regulator